MSLKPSSSRKTSLKRSTSGVVSTKTVSRIHSSIPKFISNMMEPEVPFVTPGPPAWVAPLNITTYFPIDASLSGALRVTPNFHNTLQYLGVAGANVTNFSTLKTEALAFGLQELCISRPLSSSDGQTVVHSSIYPSTQHVYMENGILAYGLPYYPGAWGMTGSDSANTIEFSASAFPAGSNVVVYSVGPSGIIGSFKVSIPVNYPQTSYSIGVPIAELTSLNPNYGIAFSIQPSTSVQFPLSDFSFNGLTTLLYAGTVVKNFDLLALLPGRSDLQNVLSSSLQHKISGLSVTLTNSTPMLNRGGFVSIAQVPAHVEHILPTTSDGVYNFLSTAPSVYGTCAMDLSTGAHAYVVRSTVRDFEFSTSELDRVRSYPSILCAYNSTEPQSLTLKLRFNVELITMNTTLPLTLRSGNLNDLFTAITGSEELLIHQCGCNPDHLERVKKAVSAVISNPNVRAAASLAAKFLPGLLAML